jgi:hypothetical protein
VRNWPSLLHGRVILCHELIRSEFDRQLVDIAVEAKLFFNLIHVLLYLGDSPKSIADIESEVEGYLYSCFGARQVYDIGIMGIPLSK